MKKFSLFLFLIIGLTAFAQQKGISYQAVIINPSEIQAPGFNGTGSPLANKSICMSFQIVNTTGQVEYQEIHSVTTDSYGMVNLVIGTGTSGTGLVSTLEAVSWNQGTKKLVVGYNSTGVCSNYTEVSNQLLNYSPYSLYAQNADIKDGYVTDVKVAMGINPAKVGLGNVNNTSDASKPVSIATQTALNLKANTTDVTASLALKENQSNKSLDIVTDATSTVKYPSVKAVKDYVDSNPSLLTIGDADAINKGKIQLAGDLSGTAAVPTVPGLVLKANTADVTTALSTKVDKESGKGLSTNDYTSLEKTKLAAIIGTNTGDQDLSTFAVATDVTTSLALKEDQSNKSLDIVNDATSTIKYPSVKAVKDYVDSNASSLTIGAISSTSTSTGANITFGVLNLAPADASNAGIVTTGVQTFGGAKTFSADLVVNSITIGKGNSEVWGDPNETEPIPNTTNTAIGFQVLKDNFDGIRNTGVGYKALSVNDEGSSNTAIGFESLSVNLEGNNNTGIGSRALANNIGDRNTAIGGDALFYNVSGDYNTSIGSGSGPSGTNRAILNNTTAVGYNALVTENNTIQLGNTAVTNVKTSGTLTAGTVTYPNTDGLNGQVLTTNGTGALTWTTPRPTYVIGDRLAGGIVFYVYDNGKHGLIANTFDQTPDPIVWSLGGAVNISTGARADGIGAGFKNTTIIIGNYGGSADPLDAYAATVCNEFVNPYEGYISDWYLPSIYELNLLFDQSEVVELTSGATYWSSTEFPGTRANGKSLNSAYSCAFPGNYQESIKSSSFRVRAIRSF